MFGLAELSFSPPQGITLVSTGCRGRIMWLRNSGQKDLKMNETPRQLEALTFDAFRDQFSQIGSADGLYHALRLAPEVKSLNSGLREEVLGERELDVFIRSRLKAFVAGQQFEDQIVVAAVAVACETINKSFARQFIDYLANMKTSELMLASLIARHARRSITSTTTRTFTVSTDAVAWQMVLRLPKSVVGQSSRTFARELV